MPPRITDNQRKAVLALLTQGFDREMVAAQIGVTPGQVSAVAAHVKMGTYEQHGALDAFVESPQPEIREQVRGLLEGISTASLKSYIAQNLNRVLIGNDAEME